MRIRETFTHTKPTITIGKNGVTVNLIQEALKQLKTSEIIKIRVCYVIELIKLLVEWLRARV
jgi:RNA-binding protein YhbY